MKKIFISMPYTHPDEEIMRERANIARKYSADIVDKMGLSLVCPVLIGIDYISSGVDIQMTHQEWLDFSLLYMKGCDEVWILCIEGYDLSNGVKAEIQYADELEIPVIFQDICLTK